MEFIMLRNYTYILDVKFYLTFGASIEQTHTFIKDKIIQL